MGGCLCPSQRAKRFLQPLLFSCSLSLFSNNHHLIEEIPDDFDEDEINLLIRPAQTQEQQQMTAQVSEVIEEMPSAGLIGKEKNYWLIPSHKL